VKIVEKIKGNKLGLVLGFFFAIIHALWVLAVGIGIGQSFLDWIMPRHFIDMAYGVLPFSFVTALVIIIAAFVTGYLAGWLFTLLWNCNCKMKK